MDALSMVSNENPITFANGIIPIPPLLAKRTIILNYDAYAQCPSDKKS